MQVEHRLEGNSENYCRADIGQTESRMISHYMAAALRTKLPVAYFGLLKPAQELRSFANRYILRLPQNVSAHRRAGIGSTGFAVAITHLYWRAPRLDLYCPTETASLMRVSHVASKKE